MAKMRVYELAIDLDLDIERTIALLCEVGDEPRNHMSVVERVPARRIRQLLKQNPNAAIPVKKDSAPTSTMVVEEELKPASIDQKETVIDQLPPEESPTVDTVSKKEVLVPSVEPSEIPVQIKKAATAEDEPEVKSKQSKKKTEETKTEKVPAVQTEVPQKAQTTEETKEKPKVSKEKPAVQESKPSMQPIKPSPARKEEKAFIPKGSTEEKKTFAKAPRTERADISSSKPQRTPRPEKSFEKKGFSPKPVEKTPVIPPPPELIKERRDEKTKEKPVTKSRGKGKVEEVQLDEIKKPTKKLIIQSKIVKKEIYDDFQESVRRSTKRKPASAKKEVKSKPVQESKPTGPVVIPESLTVQELAELLAIPATTIIKSLMTNKIMAAINQKIDFDAAKAVAEGLGFAVKSVEDKNASGTLRQDDVEDGVKLVARPPVVTIMGHVDHGKTTLLDRIRSSHVVDQEAGGITQHIGAYQVTVNEQKITFLDTPGHEAFTSMRSRGAQVTDIAILIVAADDGVMPQTVEAINHAKAANVPIVVAINKIDRPGANPDRIKQQLCDHGLVPEEWGGETICVSISALKSEGITELLEMLLLVAEMKELKANPNRLGQGVVIEAELDKNRGPVATVLVQNGTLKLGDSVVAGSVYGRIRAMFDEYGNTVTEAGPSRPVEVLGLSEVPQAGDRVNVVEDDKEARLMAQNRSYERQQMDGQKGAGRLRLTELMSKGAQDGVKDLKLILKADVQGSIQALYQAIEKLSTPEVRVSVIHSAVGGINESDVNLAVACDAIIIGYNVRPDTSARKEADRVGVEIRLYRVIYEAIDDIKAAIEGLLDPTFQEVVLGRAEVRALFKVPNVGTVAGCYVTDGKIQRQAELRLIRDNVVVYEGKLAALKRFKDDVKEVASGYECGISIERFNDIKEGDIIEAFVMQEVK